MAQHEHSKIPITCDQFEEATAWLETWPHAVGALTLTSIVACVNFDDLPHRAVTCGWWLIVLALARFSVVRAEDMVRAWERGVGKWYVRER